MNVDPAVGHDVTTRVLVVASGPILAVTLGTAIVDITTEIFAIGPARTTADTPRHHVEQNRALCDTSPLPSVT